MPDSVLTPVGKIWVVELQKRISWRGGSVCAADKQPKDSQAKKNISMVPPREDKWENKVCLKTIDMDLVLTVSPLPDPSSPVACNGKLTASPGDG
ncbi:hypothetical protein STEG23_007997 [Scotinomys teguina]